MKKRNVVLVLGLMVFVFFNLTVCSSAPQTVTETKIEYIELPPVEIVRSIMIASVEYIIFGPDKTEFNADVDKDAAELNILVLDHVADLLKGDSNLMVRIEGHANPVDIPDLDEDELIRVSTERVNEIERLLREKGVNADQIVDVSYGGARVVSSDAAHRNRNRRVELIVVQINTDN